MAMRRSRPIYAIFMLMVTAFGLASRSRLASHLPEFVATYAGDTLWALMAFLTLGFLLPHTSTCRIAGAAMAIAVSVEFSQLFNPLWLEPIRTTRAGAILLGHDFVWSDLLCYASGITAGAALEYLMKRNRAKDI